MDKIKNKYDLIITFFWQNFITAKTLEVIYKETKIPILIHPVDMFPMTGGCIYPDKCKRFYNACGCCPALNSTDKYDQTYKNFTYKKNVYSNINCAFYTNSYMLNMMKQSSMFQNVRLGFKSIILNENVFCQQDIDSCRNYFNIPSNKKFILLARSTRYFGAHDRKGMHYLIDSINVFCKNKSSRQLEDMLLILVGTNTDDIESEIAMEVMNMGIVNTEDLIKLYSVSKLFLSPSVDDAGPSMVNQALMCSTPCVTFEIGTAIDVIDHEVNGYKAKLRDSIDFSHGIEYFFSLNDSDYHEKRNNARRIAMKFNSMKRYEEIVSEAYLKFTSC